MWICHFFYGEFVWKIFFEFSLWRICHTIFPPPETFFLMWNCLKKKFSENSLTFFLTISSVALILCLGFPADLYLIDEPSAMLDAEQRLIASKIIKRYHLKIFGGKNDRYRFILHNKKTAFIVEHDFIMATYLADRVIVYEGKPSEDCVAKSPVNLVEGMNMFLKRLDVTFRRDPKNWRPRVNKVKKIRGNFKMRKKILMWICFNFFPTRNIFFNVNLFEIFFWCEFVPIFFPWKFLFLENSWKIQVGWFFFVDEWKSG